MLLWAKLQHLAALLIVWVGLIGLDDAYNHPYLSLISVLVTYFISLRLKLLFFTPVPIIKSIAYCIWLLVEVVKSAIAVTKIIWKDNLQLNSCMLWLEFSKLSPVEKVIYANSITLTPGTAVVDTDNKRMLVHILSTEIFDTAQLHADFLKLKNKVLKIQQ
ncbi:na+/H+ ion antiporter subunit [Orientia chuto str. Dubai]|uniref:Na+/H+ ion antiporter subunit n=1 Tax=Orientia chuto str. Dubai TaxID=1359168 RepID=A0A0F3MNE2_9RICK|nr:Na+/H+ antiporter subunit E [Candidatus Orientia mediorientalis]KJV57171.1 na+/H+ ion antiporter subunit [Orientia chuto str. Dubai]